MLARHPAPEEDALTSVRPCQSLPDTRTRSGVSNSWCRVVGCGREKAVFTEAHHAEVCTGCTMHPLSTLGHTHHTLILRTKFRTFGKSEGSCDFHVFKGDRAETVGFLMQTIGHLPTNTVQEVLWSRHQCSGPEMASHL